MQDRIIFGAVSWLDLPGSAVPHLVVVGMSASGGKPTFAALLVDGRNGRREIVVDKFPCWECLKNTPAAHQTNEISFSLARVSLRPSCH